jgi:hypothetical protein
MNEESPLIWRKEDSERLRKVFGVKISDPPKPNCCEKTYAQLSGEVIKEFCSANNKLSAIDGSCACVCGQILYFTISRNTPSKAPSQKTEQQDTSPTASSPEH